MKRLGLGLLLLTACSSQGGARPTQSNTSGEPAAMQQAPAARGPCDDVLAGIGVPAETPLKACSTIKADARCLSDGRVNHSPLISSE